MPDPSDVLSALPPKPRAAASRVLAHPLAPAGLLAIALGLISGLTVAAHEVYESVTEGDGVAALDHPVLQFMLAHRTGSLTAIAQLLAYVGDVLGATILTVVLAAVLCLVRRDLVPLAVIASAMAGSLTLTNLGKAIVARVRPEQALALPPFETSPSFPSGHTLNAAVLMAVVAYLAWITVGRRWLRWAVAIVCAGYAAAMGASRVYLGAHWLTDVLAAALIGLAWALAVITAHQIWVRHRHHSAQGGRTDCVR